MKVVARTTRRIIGALVNVALVAAMFACLAYVVPSFLGYERYVITGGSMSGTFEKGSIAFEQQVPVDELTVGDVITYLPPADSGVSTLVTHRIVSVETAEDGAPLFRTQGDANADPDPWQFQLTAETQPVVDFTVPWIGNLFIALADRQVRILVIGLPAAVIGLMALRDLIGAVRTPGRRHEDTPAEEPAGPAQEPASPAHAPAALELVGVSN